MIVTLTVNPAIDHIVNVDRLAFEDRAYVNSSGESAGGRGINSSCVIHSFGGQTLAVLISGGDSGKRLESHLANCGYPIRVVPIRNEIRTNLTITDKHGLTVNLNEAGPELSPEEVDLVESAVRDALDRASWLLLCGSLPPGVPVSFYGKLISMARRKKVKTLLRANGDALREGIEARPTVAAPNQQEAERLLGRTLLTAWSMRRDPDPAEALRWGVAAGTASARLPGMSFASLAQTEEIYRKVELRRVE